MLFTGHTLSPVVPRKVLTPLQKESVLDFLMEILSCCGLLLLSTEMLLKDK